MNQQITNHRPRIAEAGGEGYIKDVLREAMALCEQKEIEYEEINRYKYPEMQASAEDGCRSCYYAIEELLEQYKCCGNLEGGN